MRVWILTVCCVALLGCGAPAILDASSTIASLRGCEPAELTIAATGAGYQVSGCGPGAVYDCAEGACTESSGGVDEGWASAADAALAAIESAALVCNHGAPVTVQVLLDGEGRPQDMISELSGDERACVGRLVLAAEFPAGESERLVSHRFGASASAPIADPEPAPEDEPSTGAPEEDSATDTEPLEGP